MKPTTNYEARALKFAYVLVSLFSDCFELTDFIEMVKQYNFTHSRKLKYAHGVSRFTIMRADYVIKFDMDPEMGFEDGRAGNCFSEEAVYERACEEGFEYLLAKTSVYTINGKTFSIMPRINGVNDYSREWYEHCTAEEYDWLCENINDLHDGNVGYRNGKVCVIDYAWDL